MSRKAILLHARDNVATAVVDLKGSETVSVSLDELSVSVEIRGDIAFGHKFALHDIGQGEEIIKFGLPIGKALSDIRAGEWISVHNCRSRRYGFHNEQYGIRA